MRSHSTRPSTLGFTLALALTASPVAAGQTGAHPPLGIGRQEARAQAPEGEPVDRQVARELVRLDERLGLGTFPDGSPLWPARLAASIERLTAPRGRDTETVPGRELLRRLADDLRALGADRPLGGPPEAQHAPDVTPAGRRRAEHLERLLATARLLNRKLDRAPAGERQRASGATGNRLAPRLAPANDDCASATSVGIGTFTGTTSGATSDGSSSCGSSGTSPDVWYRYAATQDGMVAFDTYGSSYDTVLSLHSACPGAGGTELGCSDDADGSLQSSLGLDMTAGQEVWIRVSGFGGDAGAYTLHVAETGGLSGTVTRRDTGVPLAGTTVMIYGGFGYYVTETQTAADGTYSVGDLAPGTYRAWARAGGFVDELYDGVSCPAYFYCDPYYDGTPITVGSGVTGGIDFSLAPGGSIAGTVTESGTGDPLQGYVELYGATGYLLTSTTTAVDGSYELAGLPGGKYFVAAQSTNHRMEVYDDVPCSSCDVTTGTQVQLTTGATVTGVDFALDRLGEIDGTVTDESTSSPIPSMELELFDSQGYFQGSAYTASDGTYRIQGVPTGTYFLRTFSYYGSSGFVDELWDDISCENGCSVTSGTPISVTLAATISGVDFTLVPRGRIAGRVTETGSGSGLGSAYLEFYDAAGSYESYTYAASDGTYLSPGLPSGDHFVAAYAPSHRAEVYDDLPCAHYCDPVLGTAIGVTTATTMPGIDFALDRLGRIEGTVTGADTGSPLYAQVLALDSSGQPVAYAYTYTGSSAYQLVDLLPGTYFVKAIYLDDPDEYEDAMYPAVPCEPSCELSQATTLTVGLATTLVGVNLSLDRCSLDSYADLQHLEVFGSYTAEACERASATATTVHAGAALTLRSGREVVLGDGFVVESGASFQAVVDPGLVQP